MTENPRTLKEYFDAARTGQKPQLVSSRDVDVLLERSVPLPTDSKNHPNATRCGTGLLLIALAIMTGALTSLSLMGRGDDGWEDVSRDPRYRVFVLRDSLTGDSTVLIVPTHELQYVEEAPESGPVTIPEERLLELTPEELARVGARVDTSGIWIYTREMSGRVAENGFVREGTSIVDNPDRSRWEMLDPPALYPKVITDDRGRIRETRFEESDVDSALAVELGTLPVGSREYLRLQRELGRKGGLYTVRQINTLVPILVHSGRTYTREDSLRGRWHPDIVLWYEPTSEFLALLPGRVREKLEALVTVSTRPEAPGDRRSPVRSRTRATARGGGESPVETKSGETIVPTTGRAEAVRAEGPVTGEATYPVARRAFGALTDVLVAPNPAQERTLVRCRLSEPRSLRIVLHDIFGREIRELANVRPTGPECVVELSLRGVRSGIYLVSVSSDRGEQVVQRLVVK